MLRPVLRYPHVFQRSEASPLLIPLLQSVQVLHIFHIGNPIARLVLIGFDLDTLLQQVLPCTRRTARTTFALDGRELG